MTNAELTRKNFWEAFERILIENGEPFKIVYRSSKIEYWASVNKYVVSNYNSVDIGLVLKENKLRLGLWLHDKTSDIAKKLQNHKKEIEEMLSFKPIWSDGLSNKNALRIMTYIPLDFEYRTYREVIENALPIIIEFIAVAKKYGEQFFFDF